MSSEPHFFTLSVAECLPKDVGRGIARMDPLDMSRGGIQVGDVVQLAGKRATGARAMPAYPGDRGKGVVQIDAITRENAGAGVGELVTVRRTSFPEVSTVVLAPLSPSKTFVDGDPTRLARALEGLPVARGDRLRASLLAGRNQEFSVLDIDPEGGGVMGAETMVKLKGQPSAGGEKGGTTYEDIGALHQELQKIREMVELPLKYPELFQRLGIEAPKGVLLHGPPGCGKTLIARAVANETSAAFFHVSGPDVIHKFYGESEAHLRAIFDKASEQAPAIIFIDEIDAIASKREEVRGDQQVERRVVAQLLALMDGLKARGQVIVIAATNIPQVLDPALRRPGRFDREISIRVPDRAGRQEILQIHTQGMPLASDVNLGRLADVTHGFVGADLEALCREAAMAVLRRVLPRVSMDADYVPHHVLSDLVVTMEDFLDALKEVEPSAIREVFTEIPDVRWEDVGGLSEAKRLLMEVVEWPLKYPELFRQLDTRPPKGILLTGPPGTGKTLLAKAVASQSGVNFISIKGPAFLSKWVGESERAVREVFKKARQASPCIIFFDEIDALAPVRGAADSSVADRVIGQMLAEMDGVEELRGVMILAATNRPDLVDAALLRPGRFEIPVELPVPDEQARREIFAIHTRGKPLAGDVDLEHLARATQGLVGAEIEAVCREACMSAIRQWVYRGDPGLPFEGDERVEVTAEHFRQAMVRIMGRRE